MALRSMFSDDRARALHEQSPVVIMTRGHSGSRVLGWAIQSLGVDLGAVVTKKTADIQDRRFTDCIKDIACAQLRGETDDRATRRQADDLLSHAARTRKWMDEQRREAGMRPTGPLWGWKFPETYLIGPVVALAFPNARYIELLRDGRDVAFKSHLTDDPKRTLGRLLLQHENALHAPAHIRGAMSWAFQVRRFAEFAATLPEGRLLSVRFEDLVTTPLVVLERCATFLGLPVTEECCKYLADKVNPAKAAQHREKPPEMIAEVEAAIGPTLETFGYAPATPVKAPE
ncbi:MAG: sulfotransferase [Phycisphaerales bacterium]|nr:MAG: sulfotransferase [Phycisphaerales bacterium]